MSRVQVRERSVQKSASRESFGPQELMSLHFQPCCSQATGSAVGFGLSSCDDRLETTLTCRRRHRTPWSLSTYSQQLLQTHPLQKKGAPPPLARQLAFWLLVAMSCVRNSQVTAATWGGVGRSHLRLCSCRPLLLPGAESLHQSHTKGEFQART